MIDIKPNLAEAVAFAVSLPTDQAHLCAIHPAGNRPVVGRSFPKTEAGQAAALRWLIEADRKGYGVYFNANEVEPLGKGHAKAKEAEVSTVRFLHVDADLPAGTGPDDVETARAELLAKIKAAPLVPSLIINSGNGFGLFWELAEPVILTAENLEDIKARNVALADQLGGDDCENLDRVMRLPFTVNRPNAKKIKSGRVPILADIVTDLRGLVVYALEEFVPAAVSNEMSTTPTKSSGAAYETIGSPDIPETVDLSKLDDNLRSVIENGPPESHSKSRSEAVYNCACDLRRFGWSDGEILGVLTDPMNAIADHIFDQKQREPIEQASRVIMDMNRKGVAQVFSDNAPLAGGRSPPYQRTTLPVPVQAIIKGTTKAELLPPNAAMSETKEPKTETTPLGPVGPKRGRRRGRQPENQKLPAEVAKAGGMLSPERMRIVLDSLTEVPILYHAATKAGIHRKTLEYWLRRSAAGDAGYDIEWQGFEWRFHEHCTSAIDQADDSLRAVMWQIAMGVVSKTDENGNFILEACGQPNMKMARLFLEWQLPEKYGKRRKKHVPHNAGVLVIGGDVTKKPEYDTIASVKARKWKSFSRKFRETNT
jgi:hypothetical protein